MTTVVNNSTPTREDTGLGGAALAILVLVIVFAIAALIYLVSLFGNPSPQAPVVPPKIEVPVDVKVNPSPAP